MAKGWYERQFQANPVATMIATALGIAGIGYLGYRVFRRPLPPVIPKYNLPAGGGGIPTVGHDPKGKPIAWSPMPLANELKMTMQGLDWGFPGAKEAAWYKLSILPTDDMVTATYNAFNILPGVSDYGTLANWINDEVGYITGTSSKGPALARLRKLGLP